MASHSACKVRIANETSGVFSAGRLAEIVERQVAQPKKGCGSQGNFKDFELFKLPQLGRQAANKMGGGDSIDWSVGVTMDECRFARSLGRAAKSKESLPEQLTLLDRLCGTESR